MKRVAADEAHCSGDCEMQSLEQTAEDLASYANVLQRLERTGMWSLVLDEISGE